MMRKEGKTNRMSVETRCNVRYMTSTDSIYTDQVMR